MKKGCFLLVALFALLVSNCKNQRKADNTTTQSTADTSAIVPDTLIKKKDSIDADVDSIPVAWKTLDTTINNHHFAFNVTNDTFYFALNNSPRVYKDYQGPKSEAYFLPGLLYINDTSFTLRDIVVCDKMVFVVLFQRFFFNTIDAALYGFPTNRSPLHPISIHANNKEYVSLQAKAGYFLLDTIRNNIMPVFNEFGTDLEEGRRISCTIFNIRKGRYFYIGRFDLKESFDYNHPQFKMIADKYYQWLKKHKY